MFGFQFSSKVLKSENVDFSPRVAEASYNAKMIHSYSNEMTHKMVGIKLKNIVHNR